MTVYLSIERNLYSFAFSWNFLCSSLLRDIIVLDVPISNSLTIHEEKTKEITTVKEVWICDPNYHKIR